MMIFHIANSCTNVSRFFYTYEKMAFTFRKIESIELIKIFTKIFDLSTEYTQNIFSLKTESRFFQS